MERQVENKGIAVVSLPQDTTTIQAWQQLAQTSPYAAFFQTPQAYRLYASQPYLDAFALGVMQNQTLVGVVVGYIQAEKGIKAYFSSRAIINGGLLLDTSITHEAVSALLQALKQRTRKAIYVEIRNHHSYETYKQVFAANGFDYQPHLNVKITCDTWQNAINRMDNNRRRVLNKWNESFTASLSYCYATTPEQVTQFYALLQQHYKQKVRKPLFPYAFFETLITTQAGRLLLLYHQNKIIGGMVQVVLPHKVVYDYYACALDSQYKELSPSVLLYAITMQEAIKAGIPQFDTMGAGKPNVPYGVRNFKLRFGGELVENGRFLCINKPVLYRLGVWAMSLVNHH